MTKRYDGYLLDLDGTVYRGEERIDAAGKFVSRLQAEGIPYLFVTNNSSKRPDQVADKLRAMGVPGAEPEKVVTPSIAAANVLAEKMPGASVYVIGEEGLHDAMTEKGLRVVREDADAVVIGIDRGITYEKLAGACLALQAGAEFYSTNPDVAIPTERGLLPGNGSLTAVLTTATGREPIYIGKPEAVIIEQALEMMGTKKERTLMVGDNYDTDILAGIRAGLDTLLVHTGVTTKKLLSRYEVQPSYTADSLSEWQLD